MPVTWSRNVSPDQVLILGGGMEGERIRIAPPLTIGTKDLQGALEVMLSRLSAASAPVAPAAH